jgi:hypothetical protein
MKPALSKEEFYAQFPKNEKQVMAAEGYERPDWHTLMSGVPEDHAGKPFHFKRGGSVGSYSNHPAASIPGIHIVGHLPIFHGKP